MSQEAHQNITAPLLAPFPWFGGKRRVAADVWLRFGDVANFIEPFAGSLAVLLNRPTIPRIETVNDKDAFICNAWRAIQHDPEAVAYYADAPVNETDLHARHLWLVTSGAARVEMLTIDPDFYDAKIAGWWIWGLSSWVGSGWCTSDGRKVDGGVRGKRPHLTGAGKGINRKDNLPRDTRQIPSLMGGKGVNRLSRQVPHLSNAGCGVHRSQGENLSDYINALSERLRRVRVCCGEYWRVLKPSVVECDGIAGVFLDPPYDKTNTDNRTYRGDTEGISDAVRQWAIDNGNNSNIRIALCGYEGEHDMPADWEVFAWKAVGGYSNFGDGKAKENAKRERIWFSPHCLKVDYPLFAGASE